MKRDFRAPKNKGTFEANFAKKKYPQNKMSKNQARHGFFQSKNLLNYAGESSLQCVILPIRRGHR